MERLSNIMRTAQQPYSAAHQRHSQQFPEQGQHHPVPPRRPLPEQEPGQARDTNFFPAPPAHSTLPPRPSEAQQRTWREPESTPSRPAGRATYGNQRPQRTIPTPRYSEQPPPGDYYEERSNALPANSQDDWNDDTAGMRYGDWESAPGYARTSNYQEEDYALPITYPNQASPTLRQPTQETRQPAPRPAQPRSKNDPMITRELYRVTPEMARPAASRMPVPSANAHLMPAPLGLPATQRNTQPLKPQQMARLHTDMHKRAQQSVLPETPRSSSADYTIMLNSANANAACQICRGAGFLRSDVPFGHPQFGKAVACQCKEQERKRKRRQQLQEISNLGAFSAKRFESFNPRMPGVQEAFQSSMTFAQAPDGWLLLIGPNGCGKTHLAAAIANQCLEAGAVVLFATVPDLLDHLRAAFAPNASEVYDQLFARMREAEVLVLDDLGTQQSSPWASEKLFQLLNYRYNSGFPTVITANPRGLQATDERIRSRLGDVGLVESINLDRARDYRPNHPRDYPSQRD